MNATLPLKARRISSLRLKRLLLASATVTALCASTLRADEPSKSDRASPGPHIIIRSVQPTTTAAGPVVRYGLTRGDADAIAASVPGLVHLIPVRESTREIRVGERSLDVRLTGTLPDYRPLHGLRIARGRFLTEDDQTESRNVVVLGSDVVDRLFPEQSPIGEYIWIDQKVFVVIGECAAATKQAQAGMHDAPHAFLPLSAMRRRLGDREVIRRTGTFELKHVELSRIDIRLSSVDDVVATANIIRHLLDRRHDKADFALHLPFESVEGGQT
ncbi:MAG: ABC transporter permease [Maioricimonas sp. JB049]